MNDETARRMILTRTLGEVRVRRNQRVRSLVSISMLAVVAIAGVVAGLVWRGGGDGRSAARPPGIPRRVSEESLPAATNDEVAPWSSPSALVLVVNADGMEMRALNESQVRALAHKPGCQFGLTADALMWVSEVTDDLEHFDVMTEF